MMRFTSLIAIIIQVCEVYISRLSRYALYDHKLVILIDMYRGAPRSIQSKVKRSYCWTTFCNGILSPRFRRTAQKVNLEEIDFFQN